MSYIHFHNKYSNYMGYLILRLDFSKILGLFVFFTIDFSPVEFIARVVSPLLRTNILSCPEIAHYVI